MKSCVAGAPWLLVAGFALAASTGPPIDLEWIAPQQCPSQSAVLREVLRIRGDRASAQPRISARAEVWRGEDTRWHAELTSPETGSAMRKLDADSCEGVANAAALILALMVNPSRSSEVETLPAAIESARSVNLADGAAATPSASGAPPPAAAAPAQPTALRRAPADRGPAVAGPNISPANVSANVAPHAGSAPGRRGIELQGGRQYWAIGVFAGVWVGALPAPQPEAELTVAWATGPFRMEVAAGSDWSSQHVPRPSRASEGADFNLLSGLARGCYSLLPSRLSLGGCAVFELDRLHASGFGAKPTKGDAVMPAVGAAALATYGIGDRFALRILLEGVAPLARPPFVIVGATPAAVVYQPAAVWGEGLLGTEFHFF